MTDKKGKEYELMVQKTMIDLIEKEWPINQFTVEHRKKFAGKSGNSYEIDIAIEFIIADHNFLFAIECKDHSRKIEKSTIADFATRINEIKANKGLIVSTKGFQSGAIKLAKQYGIELAIICNYEYTPFTGDPAGYVSYVSKIREYLLSQSIDINNHEIQALFNHFEFHYGNAYRAEDVVAYEAKETSHYKETQIETATFDIGFELVSGSDPILIDGYDLFLVMIGQMLIKSKTQ